MSGEGEDNVEKITPDAEGKITPDKEGKYPEVVPWSKYVGIKESLGNKLEAEKTKVTGLEEKLKTAISTEDHEKIKKELEEANEKLKTASEELQGIKDKSASEKRELLVKRGVPEEKAKEMSEKEMDTVLGVLKEAKPGADLSGGGGGAGILEGKGPIALAKLGYEQGGKSNK